MTSRVVRIDTMRRGQESDGTTPLSLVARFPPNPSGKRTSDFTPYMGCGIDAIVEAFHEQVERFVRGEDRQLAISTIIGACDSSKGFFVCLTEIARSRRLKLTLASIDRETVTDYLQFLAHSGMSLGGQKKRYDFVKLVLSALEGRSKIAMLGGFPRNPFPHSNRLSKGFRSYSKQERTDIAKALRKEVHTALEKPPGLLTNFDLSCCLLAIALRTGRNETPLLEMDIECLRPHFKPGMRTLVLRKRRTNRDWTLPQQMWVEEGGAVLPGTVAIIERVIEQTAPIRHLAAEGQGRRLWISNSATRSAGKVIALTGATFRYALKVLSERHGLTNADGERLTINLKRTRKTFVNRVYEISGQNIATTAKAAGNTPRVTATSYLSPDRASEENWRFMGEAMARDLAAGKGIGITPAGRCKDQRQGEYAPHTGALCTSYLNCFRCASYVVTPEDLHKIFSLYNAAIAEREELGSNAWGRVFGNVVRSIDRDIVEEGVRRGVLTADQVRRARRQALESPHPFWVRLPSVGVESL